jgi:hypothetical protein
MVIMDMPRLRLHTAPSIDGPDGLASSLASPGVGRRRRVAAVLAGLAVLLLFAPGNPAAAQTNLVQNGSFAVTGGTSSFQFGTYGSYTDPTESLADWSSPGGYNFVFVPGSILASQICCSYTALGLWSPASSPSSANGFTNASPTGGNFIAADADFGTEPITQTINGLVAGQTYAVSFAWAASQQITYTTATTDSWIVDLGSSPAQQTTVVNLPGEGFSGWMNQTFDFVATSSSEVLSFLASGGPAGVPPFALLANVSMTQVPEPAGLTVFLTGLVSLAGLACHRRTMAGTTGRPGKPVRSGCPLRPVPPTL